MAFSLTNTGARFNDYLKGLQAEFELLSNATASTNRSRPSRFNVCLQRIKGEFDIMAVELNSFQKEREEYEAIIEAQTKELQDVRRNAVCERCGEGHTSASGILASSQITVDEINTSDTSANLSRSTVYTKSQTVSQSQSTNHPSPSTQGFTSIFDTLIFNDQAKKEIEVETVHTLSHQWLIWCVKFSQDGKYVAAGCHNGKAYIYEVQTGKLFCTLSGANSPIWSLCFSRDGQYLATASSPDFCLYIWEIKTKELRKTFKGHTRHVCSLDFSPNGQLLVSASYDGTVRLWNNGLAKILTDVDHMAFFGYYACAVFSPDGNYIAASRTTGMVWIWEVHTGQMVRRLQAHLKSANSVRFMPDGEGLVTGGTDMRFWDVPSLLKTDSLDGVADPMREFSGHKGIVSSLAISPDGRWVASGSHDESVRIWDTRTAAEQCILTTKGKVQTIDFSPAGGYLASGGYSGTIVIWRYSDNSPASVLDGSDHPPV